jgi:hypothetical protein
MSVWVKDVYGPECSSFVLVQVSARNDVDHT